jgi:hypothetical protein
MYTLYVLYIYMYYLLLLLLLCFNYHDLWDFYQILWENATEALRKQMLCLVV